MNSLIEQIKTNYELVLSEIERAKKRGKSSAEKVNLVVVTKAQPIETVRAAYAAGVKLFGENYPDETEAKIQNFTDLPEARWHMIGHLQSRKAKIVAEHFDMVHSLDSLELAIKLNNRLDQVGRSIPVLLEVNVGGEASKFGFQAHRPEKREDFLDDFRQINSLSNLEIRGLMTMPPVYEDVEQSRPHFIQMRLLQGFLRTHLPDICWDELSMGTSADFPIAVEEGATYIRVGTAIVGERPRK
jgi:pyridoxal phosphate enzyme (YggS family)